MHFTVHDHLSLSVHFLLYFVVYFELFFTNDLFFLNEMKLCFPSGKIHTKWLKNGLKRHGGGTGSPYRAPMGGVTGGRGTVGDPLTTFGILGIVGK